MPVGVLVALLGLALVAAPVAAQEHVHSEATGLGFDVPDGWQWTTHGEPADDGHDHDEDGHDHEDEAHADAIPHHLLVNYDGGLDGESPAESGQILLELGALPESFLCAADSSDLEGYLEAVVVYFDLSYPEFGLGSVDGYESTLPDGTPVGAADMSFPGIEGTWVAWPSESGVAYWAFAGSVEAVAPDDDAWRIAEGLHADLDGEGMAALFADFEFDDPCTGSLPDSSGAGGAGSAPAGTAGAGWLLIGGLAASAVVLRLGRRMGRTQLPSV